MSLSPRSSAAQEQNGASSPLLPPQVITRKLIKRYRIDIILHDTELAVAERVGTSHGLKDFCAHGSHPLLLQPFCRIISSQNSPSSRRR